ncbi:MAG: hypothetical protein ACRDHL_08645, partial [Candidatus Promineifilaceae bacterium]
RQPKPPAAGQAAPAARAAERLAELEQEISRLEARLEALAAELQAAGRQAAFAKMQPLGLEYKTVQSQLADKLEAWETLAHEQPLAE